VSLLQVADAFYTLVEYRDRPTYRCSSFVISSCFYKFVRHNSVV